MFVSTFRPTFYPVFPSDSSAWTPSVAIEGVLPVAWGKPNDLTTIFTDVSKTTLASNNNDPVYVMTNKAGGTDYVATASGTRPLRNDAALGGKPGLKWDDSDDNMQIAGILDSSYNTAVSFLIIQSDVAAANDVVINFQTASGTFWFIPRVASSGFITASLSSIWTPASGNVVTRYNLVSSGYGGKMFAFSYDGLRAVIKTNNNTRVIWTTTSAGMTGAIVLGNLVAGGFAFNRSIMENVVYKKGLSIAGLDTLLTYGANEYGLTKNTETNKVIFIGDSLTYGTGGTLGDGYPDKFMSAKNIAGLHSYMFGTFGFTAQDMNSVSRLAEINTIGGSNAIAIVWIGTNDLSASRMAAQVLTDLTAICNSIRSTGTRVIVSTIIASSALTAGKETERTTLNSSIVSGYTVFADALCDLAADARLSNYSDTTYYDVGGVHLKDAGYTVVKDLVTAVYNTL